MTLKSKRTNRAAVFDLDGTLLDTLASIVAPCNETLKRLGLPPFGKKEVRTFIGMGSRVFVEKMMAESGVEDPVMIQQAQDIYHELAPAMITHNVEPFEGVPDMLEQLQQMGLKLGVATNKNGKLTPRVLAHAFPDSPFSAVRGAQRFVPLKPHPQMLFLVMNKLKADLSSSFFIGDSDVDIETGRAAGMHTIAVSWGFKPREVLESLAPDCLADTPAEVVDYIRRHM